MLSIGKLAAGQARYYLDQAEARVDVVASVGRALRITTPAARRHAADGSGPELASSASRVRSTAKRFVTCWPGWIRGAGSRCGARRVAFVWVGLI